MLLTSALRLHLFVFVVYIYGASQSVRPARYEITCINSHESVKSTWLLAYFLFSFLKFKKHGFTRYCLEPSESWNVICTYVEWTGEIWCTLWRSDSPPNSGDGLKNLVLLDFSIAFSLMPSVVIIRSGRRLNFECRQQCANICKKLYTVWLNWKRRILAGNSRNSRSCSFVPVNLQYRF